MQISRKISTLALALCAVLGSGSAFAEKQVSAGISNIHLRLIDLDANDGITPSLQFTLGHLYESYNYYNYAARDSGYYTGPTQGNAAYNSSYNNSAANLQGQSSGGFLPNLQVNNVLKDNPSYSGNYYQLSNTSYFVLSANTGLELSFDSSVSINNLSGRVWGDGNYVSANILIYDDWWTQNIGGASNVELNSASANVISNNRHHVLRFDNNRSSDMNGAILGSTIISIADRGFTPQVPEPETYAMMLGGLGLLGVVARRRRQK